MFKNKLPVSSLISIALISIGAFFILFFISFYQDNGAYEDFEYLSSIIGLNENFKYFIIIIGLSIFVTGLSLLLKQLWTRTFLLINVVGLYFFLLYTFPYDDFPEDILRRTSFYILLTGISLSFILLLYNEKVSIEFGDKHIDKESEDILDRFE